MNEPTTHRHNPDPAATPDTASATAAGSTPSAPPATRRRRQIGGRGKQKGPSMSDLVHAASAPASFVEVAGTEAGTAEPQPTETGSDSAAAARTGTPEGARTGEAPNGAETAAEPVVAAPAATETHITSSENQSAAQDGTAAPPPAAAAAPAQRDHAADLVAGLLDQARQLGATSPEALADLLRQGVAASAQAGQPAAQGLRPGPAAPNTHLGRLMPAPAERTAQADGHMPESLRKHVRAGLLSAFRLVDKAWSLLDERQRELARVFTDAREQGFPRAEIARVMGEAQALGFEPEELHALLVETGWEPGHVDPHAPRAGA